MFSGGCVEILEMKAIFFTSVVMVIILYLFTVDVDAIDCELVDNFPEFLEHCACTERCVFDGNISGCFICRVTGKSAKTHCLTIEDSTIVAFRNKHATCGSC